jgi:membrane associated rhomboid family serine protease
VYGRGSQLGFGPPVTPDIIKTLLIANGLVFVAQIATDGLVTQLGVVQPSAVWLDLQIWRPFTYMWLHSQHAPLHIIFNMLMLWMFGSPLALVWGDQRFLRYYLVCGVGAGVLIATVPFVPFLVGLSNHIMNVPTLGASGAIMGVMVAYSFTWPDRTIMLLFPPMPLRAIWLVPLILVMDYLIGPSNVSHVGHAGGAVVGWIYLVREGRTPGAPTLKSLKHRWHRYRMRQRIRVAHEEEKRKRWEDERRGPPRFH